MSLISPTLPRIDTAGTRPILHVDGSPYLAIGGELHNSTASDTADPTSWDALHEAGVSTVLVPVAWDQLEPTEGEFDFGVVDSALANARAREIRLVVLWFGAFKNAASTYAPTWVRRDPDRFPRAQVNPGGPTPAFSHPGATPKPVLSVFGAATREADKRAYCALMRHLRDADPEHTVIMMQVENEVGLLGDSRDRSDAAVAAWQGPVPSRLIDQARRLSDAGPAWAVLADSDEGATWSQLFFDDRGDELFMAAGFACYVEELAAAGKQIKDLPAYANAWLGPQPGQDRPGQYPSGGPTVPAFDVWTALAPSLDLLAPDVYVDDAASAFADYDRPGNPLFVPEARILSGNAALAVGHHGAIGFNVFGVDHLAPHSQYSATARILHAVYPRLETALSRGSVDGFVMNDGDHEIRMTFGPWTVTLHDADELLARMLLDAGVQAPPRRHETASETSASPFGPAPRDARPFGLLAQVDDERFILVAQGVMVDFAHSEGPVEIDRAVEYVLSEADGGLRTARHLNGDERLHFAPSGKVSCVEISLLRR